MKKIKKLHFRTVLLILLILLFMWWVNNYTISVNESVVKSDLINDEITIVQISDLHGASFGMDNSVLINRITSQAPDFIAVTGDMFTHYSESGKETALNLMKTLADMYPVYYVNGEHDDDESFFDKLEENGVNVLNYRGRVITVKNTKLHLYGIDNVYFPPTFDLVNAFTKDEDTFSILLSHMAKRNDKFKEFGIDLTLSGDTHGGIFRLPFIGAVYDGTDFFPDKNGKFMKGLYEDDGYFVHITAGLGNYPLPVRCWNRPEIAVIKLQPQQ